MKPSLNTRAHQTDGRLDSVAIIMDGNGRWAERRGLPRTAGHRAGADNLPRVLRALYEENIHYVTLYAFSTENWRRPKAEVDRIMELVGDQLDRLLCERVENMDFSLRFIGNRERLSQDLQEKLRKIENRTSDSRFICSVALSYGGRDEIVSAVNRIIADGHPSVNEQLLSEYMQTYPVPDPDLIIRTGGDFRISNFLLWQSAYSEYVITDTLWPDFGREDLSLAINDFYSRHRRFGGLAPGKRKEANN